MFATACTFPLLGSALASDIDDLKALLNATMNRVTALEQWKAAHTNIDSGHTAWIMTSSTLVLLMSLPGLALFYGGMAQVKNVLSTVFQTFSIACLVSVLWFMFGYSLAFGSGSPVYGGAQRFWLMGDQRYTTRISVNSKHALAPNIPETVYMMFQMGFAVITAAIVCGSFAERMRFRSMLVFITFWHLLVYCPVAHAVWAQDGFLSVAGALDFAGGGVVHVCSGMSGLAASIIIGPRKGFGAKDLKPHNVLYTMIGGSMLWVGWFGFNAGSAGQAGGAAGFAMLTTQISAGTAGVTWMLLESAFRGRPSVLGIVRSPPCPPPCRSRRNRRHRPRVRSPHPPRSPSSPSLTLAAHCSTAMVPARVSIPRSGPGIESASIPPVPRALHRCPFATAAVSAAAAAQRHVPARSGCAGRREFP